MVLKFYKSLLIIIFLVGLLFLSSCRDDEQDRVLNYEKGTYLGKKDTALTDQQIAKLRMHTSRQRSN